MAAEHLLIFGASARAAAFSALRAGLRPWCADLFADADLQARCPAMRLPGRYPHAFLDLAGTDLPGPWMYAGGLENWPTLVRQIARRRPLWGNGEGELVHARHPGLVRQVLNRAGLPAPAVGFERGLLSARGRWLVKPLRGAGGRGVHFLNDPPPPSAGRVPVYYQQYVEGEPCSLLYAGDGQRARCLGLTRQLVGAAWLHAGPFQYCGSVGPLDLSLVRRPSPERLGDVIVGGCGLRGLFGIDGVLRDGTFWPVEINPRYTASVEVLEYATGLHALAWHRRAFAPEAGEPPDVPSRAAGCVGKAILFARAEVTFPSNGPWLDVLRAPPPLTELPPYADVPPAGAVIAAGHPVLTLFARAGSVASCEEALRHSAADLDRRLFGG